MGVHNGTVIRERRVRWHAMFGTSAEIYGRRADTSGPKKFREHYEVLFPPQQFPDKWIPGTRLLSTHRRMDEVRYSVAVRVGDPQVEVVVGVPF